MFIIKKDSSLWEWGPWVGKMHTDKYTAYRSAQKLLDNIDIISIGQSHVLALAKDGTLWGWGKDECGSLGSPKNDTNDKPIKITLNELNGDKIVNIFAGWGESYVVTASGHLWVFGERQGTHGECGSDNYRPKRLEEFDNVQNVVSGSSYYILALKKDGTVWGSGPDIHKYNSETRTDCGKFDCPAVQMLTDVQEITGGDRHVLALKKDGTVWAWGIENSCGQLGNGTTKPIFTPTQVKFSATVQP